MRYKVNLGDLYSSLIEEFGEDTRIAEIRRTFKDAAHIVCLVDDWVTAKEMHRTSQRLGANYTIINRLHRAVIDAESALIGAVVTDHMGGTPPEK